MASASPNRPARRAARKNAIVGDSEDELSMVAQDDEEDFTPAPKRGPRKTTRRQTTANVDISPRKSARGRRAKTGEGIEPSQIFDPDASIAPSEPASPSKRASTRKRRSIIPARPKRSSSAMPEMPPPLPASAISTSPEPPQRGSRPLGDITSHALNKGSPPFGGPLTDEKFKPMAPVLERPTDIVVKTRSKAMPAKDDSLSPKPRMVIRQLTMTNFKSYAGRQVVGPFHVSFSSVVGPNGSGKSNVIDSLLFVFGFRASKMRQGKISALIHNSAQHQDLDFCEVEVHFEEIMDLPGGQHEIIPKSQMVVSRRAFKNNSSNYYIDGRTTNFTAVTNLLKDKGIDLDHKRFLILQGEVESIAQMKPKAASEHDDGLLEYLEDIIGTSKYKAPIEESASEFETLNEVCVEKQSRVSHVEKEKTALEDKKNKALSYIRDENELVEKQSALYQIYMAECEDNNKVTQEAIDQMESQLNAELEKHAGSEDSIKHLERSYKKEAREYENMEKSTQTLVREMAKYEKENVRFDEKRKFIANKQKKAEKTMTASRLSASEAVSLVEKHKDDISRKTAEVASIEESTLVEEQQLATIRDELRGKTQSLSEQIAEKQKFLEPWNAKINDKQSSMLVAQSELDILKDKANAGVTAIAEARAKIGALGDTRAAKVAEIDERQAEKAQLQKDLRKLQDALQKLARSEPEVRSQISSARQKADEARARLVSSQNQGNVLKGLMRLKESGRVDGFHGRLGNLGAIDERYDVAISTACPSLENMVVDSVDVGQQCIDYLRKNNLGRANFILLDRLARKELGPISTPEDVPRLFDLVKPKDDKFAPAFYSVMQNTIVARDLEQANRIAYGVKRWRVVTLDGQLIDVSGTMSGGGTRVAKGAMSSKLVAETSKEQVQQLELDRDELEKQFAAFEAKQRELEGMLVEKQEEIPRLDTLIQKTQLEIDSSTRGVSDAETRYRELIDEHKGSKTDEAQQMALQRQILTFQKDIDKLHGETANLEAEIQALQDKIMEVGGVRLRNQKAKVDGLKEQIGLLNEEVLTAEVAKSKNEKLKVKHEKAHADAENELAAVAIEREKLEADIATQAKDASSYKAEAEEAKEALETRKEALVTLKAELDSQTSALDSTRATEIEMRNKLEENQKILAENQKKNRYWTEKLSRLTLHDIADLEGRNESILVRTPDDPYAVEPRNEHRERSETDGEPTPASPESNRSKPQPPTYTRDELLDKSRDHLVAAIAALEEKTSNTSSIDLTVIAEYRRRCTDLAARIKDLNAALSNRDTAKSRLTDLRLLRLSQFMTGFTTISSHLKSMYQLITLGGNAELELVDSLDPFSEGILFSVMPPKKSWKNIGNLSGGEKTLSSLALVFALHVYRPTPLYVMDEIDAALDFRNVSIVASYIKERTKNAQFIVISLRNNMFELAERLVGIYKVNHMTKSVTVENKDYLGR